MTIDDAKKLLRLGGMTYYADEDKPIELNMNDTWAWATAFGMPVSDEQVIEVASLFVNYGYCGILYWVSEQNDQMRSEFHDINRFVDFVRAEETLRKEMPQSTKRAYHKLKYTLGDK